MITVGIIGALEEEVSSLLDEMEDVASLTLARTEFHAGRLHGKEVVLVQCGMGKVNAAICAQLLITVYHCSHIIFTGVAGALDPQLDVGDIVISRAALQHDYDLTPIGWKPGQIDKIGVEMKADPGLIALAEEAVKETAPSVRVFEGTIVSGDQFIHTDLQKKYILDTFHEECRCCEMEGGAVAQACVLNDTPFVILRSISDKADGSSHVSFETFKEEAAQHGEAIVNYMVEHLQ
jgi:adenosylhomocysteine nucleosidase